MQDHCAAGTTKDSLEGINLAILEGYLPEFVPD